MRDECFSGFLLKTRITAVATGEGQVLQKIAQVQEQLMMGKGVFWCLYFNVIKFLGSMSELQQL